MGVLFKVRQFFFISALVACGFMLLSACSSSITLDDLNAPIGKSTNEIGQAEGDPPYDHDRDGIGDGEDPCPDDPLNDHDGDGFCASYRFDFDGDQCITENDWLLFKDAIFKWRYSDI